MNGPSGWCTAPPGVLPKHKHCKAPGCGCPCHNDNGKAAE